MQNTVLIDIVTTFSKNELKDFEDFILSPFHNKKTPVLKLFNYIKKHYPDLRGKELHRITAWENIFPEREFNYGVMKNLIYELTRLSEEFISYSEYAKGVLKKKTHLINYFYKKNNLKLSQKYLDKVLTKSSDQSFSDPEYYSDMIYIEKIRTAMMYSRISDKHTVFPESEFDRSSNYILESFFISILENYVITNGLNKIHNSEIKLPMFEEVLNFIKENEMFSLNIFIKAYYFILLLDKGQDESYYFELKKILSGTDCNANKSFCYLVWENINNYIIFRYHAGEREMMKEIFELNKLALKKKIYASEYGENFFVSNFIIFINIAIGLNEIKWAEDFVNNYSCELEESVREDVKNYCLSGISIVKKNFTEANEYLSRVRKLHEPHMKVNLKLNTLIVYYELGWYESSLNVIDSFKHLLKNEKSIQKVIKEKHKKFITGYLLLINFKEKKDKVTRMNLEKFLTEPDGVASFGWLKRKASEEGIEIQ